VSENNRLKYLRIVLAAALLVAKLTQDEPARMPQGRVSPYVSGALIVFAQESGVQQLDTDAVNLKNGNLRLQIPIRTPTRKH
jgi:hypothetical protein